MFLWHGKGTLVLAVAVPVARPRSAFCVCRPVRVRPLPVSLNSTCTGADRSPSRFFHPVLRTVHRNQHIIPIWKAGSSCPSSRIYSQDTHLSHDGWQEAPRHGLPEAHATRGRHQRVVSRDRRGAEGQPAAPREGMLSEIDTVLGDDCHRNSGRLNHRRPWPVNRIARVAGGAAAVSYCRLADR